jgi:hypothetical protein
MATESTEEHGKKLRLKILSTETFGKDLVEMV